MIEQCNKFKSLPIYDFFYSYILIRFFTKGKIDLWPHVNMTVSLFRSLSGIVFKSVGQYLNKYTVFDLLLFSTIFSTIFIFVSNLLQIAFLVKYKDVSLIYYQHCIYILQCLQLKY